MTTSESGALVTLTKGGALCRSSGNRRKKLCACVSNNSEVLVHPQAAESTSSRGRGGRGRGGEGGGEEKGEVTAMVK